MKVSTLVVVAAAVAGVTAVPEEPGTLAHLQARARDVIGGFFQHHRREQVDTPAVAEVKRSPVRFHNGLGHENAAAERRDSGNTNPGGSPPEEEDPEASDPPRMLVLRVRGQKRSPQTGATPPPIPINDRKRSPAQTPVPPLSPFRRALRA
ncbi:hypothetical protein LY78DRAFT_669801 [Colletotrichum sublineola]|uniref:Uncharacterized protein n=1 Tax=Colletotrichum sublineola TaxID=1173701 RepID=A0A066X9K0_COLSU|nr:hypothetical protein LY78DRAFT_669801 [Colletotrichum sublineola]KDN62426.1 hypothetical protein CSUB01_04893 [Colletotrichum sublineola]